MVNDRLAWIDEGSLEVGFSEFEKPLKFGIDKGFAINENDKILLLGKNASGKTQLLIKLRELIEKADYFMNILELSSEEISWHKRKSGKDTSFLFDFYNSCKLEIKSKSENEKTVILMDNPLSVLENDTGDILLELFSTLECTVIITDLLDFHFKNFTHSMQEEKVHWSTYPKKIIIDDFNHFGSKKLIFIDSEMNRNIAEYEQIGTYLEARSSTEKLMRKSRQLDMSFRKKIVNIEKNILETNRKEVEESTSKKYNYLTKERKRAENELIDLERRLDLETRIGDDFEVAIILDRMDTLQKKIAKIHHDLKNMEFSKEIVSYPQHTEIIKHKNEIMNLRSQLQVIKQEIMVITRPMQEMNDITIEFGLSYSERKRELLSETEYFRILLLHERVDEISKLTAKLSMKYSRNRSLPNIDKVNIKSSPLTKKIEDYLKKDNRSSGIKYQKNVINRINEHIRSGESADSIDSSIAMVLSNSTRKDSVPDDLRKLALHFSRIFLNNQEKANKKLFIVNNIEKLIKYAINTADDRENTLIILHNNSTTKGDLIQTYVGPNPKKYGHADIFVIDCDGDIKPSKVRMYLNKFRIDGTSTHGHLMFIDINEDYNLGKMKSTEKHSFNSWIENLRKRTSAQKQSQSAGLHKIIKIYFDGRVPVNQSTRKASEIMNNIIPIYDQITDEWQELGLRTLIESKKNIEQISDGSLEIKEYINEKIKSYDFGKERKLYKQIWREDHETEDSLDDWYNNIFEN